MYNEWQQHNSGRVIYENTAVGTPLGQDGS